MKKFRILIIGIFCSLLLVYNSYSLENKILFKVNNEIITSLDIFNELKYLQIINKQFKNTKKNKAFEIAKKSLIREKIKKIEIEKNVKEIKLDDKLLEKILINYFNKIQIKNISDFENYFTSLSINPNLIKKKISIEIMWNQLIYSKYNQNVKIDKQSIVNDLKKNNKQKEFFLSEILFNINENEKLDQKFNLIKQTILKTNFSEAALIYSVSNTANKGGELGWIKETSLSEKIKKILQDIKIGQYSNPIIIPGGFLILKIEDIREVKKDVDLDREIEKIIKEKTNDQLNQFSNILFNKIKKNVVINEL